MYQHHIHHIVILLRVLDGSPIITHRLPIDCLLTTQALDHTSPTLGCQPALPGGRSGVGFDARCGRLAGLLD